MNYINTKDNNDIYTNNSRNINKIEFTNVKMNNSNLNFKKTSNSSSISNVFINSTYNNFNKINDKFDLNLKIIELETNSKLAINKTERLKKYIDNKNKNIFLSPNKILVGKTPETCESIKTIPYNNKELNNNFISNINSVSNLCHSLNNQKCKNKSTIELDKINTNNKNSFITIDNELVLDDNSNNCSKLKTIDFTKIPIDSNRSNVLKSVNELNLNTFNGYTNFQKRLFNINTKINALYNEASLEERKFLHTINDNNDNNVNIGNLFNSLSNSKINNTNKYSNDITLNQHKQFEDNYSKLNSFSLNTTKISNYNNFNTLNHLSNYKYNGKYILSNTSKAFILSKKKAIDKANYNYSNSIEVIDNTKNIYKRSFYLSNKKDNGSSNKCANINNNYNNYNVVRESNSFNIKSVDNYMYHNFSFTINSKKQFTLNYKNSINKNNLIEDNTSICIKPKKYTKKEVYKKVIINNINQKNEVQNISKSNGRENLLKNLDYSNTKPSMYNSINTINIDNKSSNTKNNFIYSNFIKKSIKTNNTYASNCYIYKKKHNKYFNSNGNNKKKLTCKLNDSNKKTLDSMLSEEYSKCTEKDIFDINSNLTEIDLRNKDKYNNFYSNNNNSRIKVRSSSLKRENSSFSKFYPYRYSNRLSNNSEKSKEFIHSNSSVYLDLPSRNSIANNSLKAFDTFNKLNTGNKYIKMQNNHIRTDTAHFKKDSFAKQECYLSNINNSKLNTKEKTCNSNNVSFAPYNYRNSLNHKQSLNKKQSLNSLIPFENSFNSRIITSPRISKGINNSCKYDYNYNSINNKIRSKIILNKKEQEKSNNSYLNKINDNNLKYIFNKNISPNKYSNSTYSSPKKNKLYKIFKNIIDVQIDKKNNILHNNFNHSAKNYETNIKVINESNSKVNSKKLTINNTPNKSLNNKFIPQIPLTLDIPANTNKSLDYLHIADKSNDNYNSNNKNKVDVDVYSNSNFNSYSKEFDDNNIDLNKKPLLDIECTTNLLQINNKLNDSVCNCDINNENNSNNTLNDKTSINNCLDKASNVDNKSKSSKEKKSTKSINNLIRKRVKIHDQVTKFEYDINSRVKHYSIINLSNNKELFSSDIRFNLNNYIKEYSGIFNSKCNKNGKKLNYANFDSNKLLTNKKHKIIKSILISNNYNNNNTINETNESKANEAVLSSNNKIEEVIKNYNSKDDISNSFTTSKSVNKSKSAHKSFEHLNNLINECANYSFESEETVKNFKKHNTDNKINSLSCNILSTSITDNFSKNKELNNDLCKDYNNKTNNFNNIKSNYKLYNNYNCVNSNIKAFSYKDSENNNKHHNSIKLNIDIPNIYLSNINFKSSNNVLKLRNKTNTTSKASLLNVSGGNLYNNRHSLSNVNEFKTLEYDAKHKEEIERRRSLVKKAREDRIAKIIKSNEMSKSKLQKIKNEKKTLCHKFKEDPLKFYSKTPSKAELNSLRLPGKLIIENKI